MPRKIFISYRRDDDPSAAARVRDGLAARFGKAALFMDVDNLLAGQRFDDELAKALAACDVLVAIIGARWMDVLSAKTAADERDFVCEELGGALQRRIVVIPVRVGREGALTPLPRPAELPDAIRDLVQHQKHDVTHEHFSRDVASLADAIATVRRIRPPVRQWRRIAAAIAFGFILGGGVLANQVGLLSWPTSPSPWRAKSASQKATETATKKVDDDRKRFADAAAQTKREQEAREKADDAERRRLAAELKRKADEEAARRDPAMAAAPGSGKSIQDKLADGSPCPMCPKLVVVPAGHFAMGSPDSEPERSGNEMQVPVAIAQPFAAGQFAVTFDEWDACVSDHGCNEYKPSDQGWGRGKLPAINVSRDDAKSYVSWLSRKTGKTYRLLSEAEREYVARAGTTTPFWWGKMITPKQANYDGSVNAYAGGGANGEYRRRTVPVDSFDANPWGLYNVHGNVWEWTEDCWNDANSGNPGNGGARTSGDCSRRVLRGGSWFNNPPDLRSANRSKLSTNSRSSSLGFRVGRTLAP